MTRKRLFDIIFSLTVLIAGAPLFLLIALAVKCSSKGPVIYAQERIGLGGRPFLCYKFRTMYEDAELRLSRLLAGNAAFLSEWEATRKIKNDPRITSVGRFLRKTSLDELPQFWNVLKGDLSVVGPRPVVRSEIDIYFGAKAGKILSIRPGLTGIWQVSGRSDTGYAKRLHLDETYIDNHSLLLDIKLILRTIPCMIFPEGAY